MSVGSAGRIGVGYGKRRHVHNPAHCGAGCQNVHWLGGTQQDRSDGDVAARSNRDDDPGVAEDVELRANDGVTGRDTDSQARSGGRDDGRDSSGGGVDGGGDVHERLAGHNRAVHDLSSNW